MSCRENDPEPENRFVFDGDTYELTKGFLEDFGYNGIFSGEETYGFDVMLISDGINYNAASEDFEGSGSLVFMDLSSTLENDLVAGTYRFSSSRGAFSLVDGVVGVNYNIADETGELLDVIGGEVTVSVDGADYTFDFDLTLDNNTTVEGRYVGTLRRL
ncbi:MAG: hypothetical protein WBA12_00875 [Catalinimonas sp.]